MIPLSSFCIFSIILNFNCSVSSASVLQDWINRMRFYLVESLYEKLDRSRSTPAGAVEVCLVWASGMKLGRIDAFCWPSRCCSWMMFWAWLLERSCCWSLCELNSAPRTLTCWLAGAALESPEEVMPCTEPMTCWRLPTLALKEACVSPSWVF